MGWSLSELLLACLRASRSLAPTQGNLESVWELDSMSATSKKRTSRGYPTISWLWAGLEVSANIYFRTKRSLFWEDSRDVSHFLFTSHIFGGIHALKKLKVKMIWFQRDLFIPSLGCSYQSTENKMDKNKWTRTYFSKCVISSKAKWLKFKISKSNFANGDLRRGSKKSV